MIVITQSLDSMLARETIFGIMESVRVNQVFTEFDHVALLTQDTAQVTWAQTQIEHIPCAFSHSKSVRWILSRFKYLRWAYFFAYSSVWILRHRRMIRLLVSINVDSPASLFSALFGIPCVIYYHYDTAYQVRHINKRMILGLLLLAFERFAFRRVGTVWVTSPSLMAKVKSLGAKRVRIISNWVDLKEIEKVQTSTKKSGKFRILFVGRLHPVKQVDLLIRAFHLVHKRNPDTELYILGDGEQRQSLINLAKGLDLVDAIHFTGFVNHSTVYKMMKQSNMYVLPSKLEGNPRVLIEAMVSKIPIVATNVPGIRDLIDHTRTGYLVNKQEPEELAKAIEYVLRNEKDSADMVTRAYTFVAQNFSKEIVLQKIRDELGLLLSNQCEK